MKKRVLKLGLALGALLLLALAVPLFHLGVPAVAALLFGVAGYTVTYGYAGAASNTTTAPTAAQSSMLNLITAQLALGDTETTANITHNWGLPASAPSMFFPIVSYVMQANSGAQTAVPALTFSWLNTNVLVVNKLNANLSGGTFILTLMRPHSILAGPLH
jgi:hypothetical protein